jgi:hypothetical protein
VVDETFKDSAEYKETEEGSIKEWGMRKEERGIIIYQSSF